MVNQEFLKVISSDNFHIPLESNFIVQIEDLTGIVINLDSYRTVIADNNLRVYPDTWKVTSDDVYFANGAKIPGDGSESSRVGVTENLSVGGGLLSGPTLRGRKDLANLEITFLETNKSFIDFVMRPWIVAISQFGLFSRKSTINTGQGNKAGSLAGNPGKRNYQDFRTNVTITFLDKTSDESVKTPRKQITFFNAAPINMSGYDVSYGNSKNGMRVTAVNWVYSTYKMYISEPSVPQSQPATVNNPFITAFNNGLANPKPTPVNFNNPMLNALNNGIAAGRGVTPVNFNNPMLNALNNGIAAGKK